MRVTTAFNRMLRLPGASVQDVAFGGEGVIVTVRLRRKRPVCSGCGARGLKIKEHRVKRWRHLDLGACRCEIECVLRRLYCPGCGDVYEQVPWARAGSPYTRDFEDVVAFLAQQMAKTPITKLMRIGWRSVGKILARVVADKLDRGRLDGLVMIGVDEVSYASEHRFLTCVADHQTGGVVWAAPGRNAPTLAGVLRRAHRRAEGLDHRGLDRHVRRLREGRPRCAPRRCRRVRSISCGAARRQGRRPGPPRRVQPARPLEHRRGKWIKGARYSLLKDTANQTTRQLLKLAEVVLTNKRMYRAFLLLGELRYIYRLPKHEAVERLDAWLAWASRSRLKPFVKLARTIRQHKAGVLAAIELGISNGRLEASTAASG